jgi:hypothetical protein
LAARLKELEMKVDSHDVSIAKIFEVIRQMLDLPRKEKEESVSNSYIFLHLKNVWYSY